MMNITRPISRHLVTAFFVVAAVAQLSACGGGSGGDSASPTGVPAASNTPSSPSSPSSPSNPGSAQILPCVDYISTGFNGDINAVYPDGLGGMTQASINVCSTVPASGEGTGSGDSGSSGGDSSGGVGGASGEGGAGGGDSSGDGGAGGGDGGSGDGGAGAGGGEGKVINALMTVTRLSDGAVLGSAITDPVRGLVTIRPRASDGPVLLTLTGRPGAQYYDEGIDRMVDFGPDRVLHALVDQFDENIGVTPLTEAAYLFALNNFTSLPTAVAIASGLKGLTADQVRAANEAARIAINATLDPKFQLDSVKSLPTPVDNSSAVNALPANRYGIAATVIGGLVKAGAKRRPNSQAPALGVTEQLSKDLTDGKVDGMALDKTPAAPLESSYYDAPSLPASLAEGAAEMSNRFGKGTVDVITVLDREREREREREQRGKGKR
jgi:hypothetical protein